MAKLSRQRQAAWRERLKQQGLARFCVTLDERTITSIRALAEQHQRTQAEVIQLGILLASRALADSSEG